MRPKLQLVLALLLMGLAARSSAFELAGPKGSAVVVVPASEPECVRIAAMDLIGDTLRITGKSLELVARTQASQPATVVLLSMNQPSSAALLEELAPGFGDGLKGRWEAYRVGLVGSRLIVAGSDERGTMFGLYAFIEDYLGVDPLHFWASRPPVARAALAWDRVELNSGGPTFKYRGWFINDEDLLTEWKASAGRRNIDYPYYGQVVPREVMRHIAEALVRSRCNLIIPASFIDIMNPPEEALVEECARRGVFVSQHHVEPMGVSAFAYFNYWKARGRDLKYSYFSHPAEVREVWTAYARKWAGYPNVIWQLGLRGIADRPMWMADPLTPQSDADRGRLISEAMAEQVKILQEIAPGRNRVLSTTLWAEGSVLNQKGLLTIPESTIIVFADNSPGWRWQADFHSTPRSPRNTYGVYYHHALWGSGPHLAQVVAPHRTFACLRAAVEKEAGSYVICNVSNLREFVLGVDATAKMAWRLDDFDPENWLASWVRGRFSARRPDITTAYLTYFNAWQVHAEQQVPSLMDGQMIKRGLDGLNAIGRKLSGGGVGGGVAPEVGRQAAGLAAPSGRTPQPESDAFWSSINDMHPVTARRDAIRHVAAQRTGLEMALLSARSSLAALPHHEAEFLRSNLIHQAALAVQFCLWMESVETAHEALDLGDLPACREALVRAEAAFAVVPRLGEDYGRGPWENWYRGAKKINLGTTLSRTREVLARANAYSPSARTP